MVRYPPVSASEISICCSSSRLCGMVLNVKVYWFSDQLVLCSYVGCVIVVTVGSMSVIVNCFLTVP